MNIRETLIKLRDDSNLSQQEFADMLEVSRQTVSRWEAGKSVPSSAQISKICKAFKIDANALLSDTVEESQSADNPSDGQVQENSGWNKRKTAIFAVAGVLLLISLAGLIVTIVYAVKDALYDSSATVWIVAIPGNTPMIILSVFLAVFIALLAAVLIYLLRSRKK